MASMEIYDSNCDTPGCAARAMLIVKDKSGTVVGKHCRKDAGPALKAQTEQERAGATLKDVSVR